MYQKYSNPFFAATVVLAGIATATDTATCAEKGANTDQQTLIKVLQSDSPAAEKAITCKKLAVFGDAKCVPALAPLLADKELISWARIALEAIPGPEADQVLREAAGTLQGRQLIGVLNSIGVRRDAKAVEILEKRLADPDAEVAAAAAVALGRIGGGVIGNLEPVLANAKESVRSAAAEGCILCAEQALAAGNQKEAARIYELVRQANLPKQRLLEATRGAILAQRAAGVPLLVEQLQSDDRVRFRLGLTVARELDEPAVTQALVDELKTATPQRQVPLMLTLADRGDKQALPALLNRAQTGTAQSRLGAFRVLTQLGDASCIPVLLAAAMGSDEAVSPAATEALADLPGNDVDAKLISELQTATGKARRVLIQVVGLRQLQSAVPKLIAAAAEKDAATRVAALTSLGFVVSFADLPVLIQRVTKPAENAEERDAAVAALRVACERMPDREACAGRLMKAWEAAPTAAKINLLEVLAVMGGKTALNAMDVANKSGSAELQDASSRLLGEWMSADAAPVLLNLAKTASSEKYEIRAIRGYIRLARQFTMGEEQRVAMCETALKTARRTADKKLVMEVLARYPSVATLRLAVNAAQDPALATEARATGLLIAQRIGGDANVQQLLAQIGQKSMKIEILKAEYGAGSTFRDVTAIVRKQTRDLPLILLPSTSYNRCFGGDPVPSVVKTLKIQYKIDGRPGEASFEENATILLPTP